MLYKKTAWGILSVLTFALVLTACNTSGKEGGQFASIPAGKGYAEGYEIYFAHTEASDVNIAKTLTDMMKSPVLLVPSLAEAPDSMLAHVYVFENGVKGTGPLGFQPDVFDAPPKISDKYTPLRRLITVRWNDSATPRELKAAAEIAAAQEQGELTTIPTKVVINRPFLTWYGGQR